jgi:hypothetical protein
LPGRNVKLAAYGRTQEKGDIYSCFCCIVRIMPTLIRLVIALVFLAGLGYAAMFALTVMVDPGTKEITVRIPPRDLNIAPVKLPPVLTTSQPPVQPSVPDGPE